MEKELSKSYINRLSLSPFLDKENNTELFGLYEFISYLFEKGYLDDEKIIENVVDINLELNIQSILRTVILNYIDTKKLKLKNGKL